VPPTAIVRGAADQLMERGEYAKAADKYQEAVALAPDDSKAWADEPTRREKPRE